MPFSFVGSIPVLEKTIFTNNGPIVKAPLALSSGADLYISSPNSVRITTGNFNNSIIGQTVTISGSPGGRNDGLFTILSVKSFNTLELDANFDYSDTAKITGELITFVNSFKEKYNSHILSDVHGVPDTINTSVSSPPVDVASIALLLNDIKNKLSAHSILTGSPVPVHKFSDPDASIFANDATDLASCIILANALRNRYELHRQDRGIHLDDDFINRLIFPKITSYTGTGSLIGPFNWVISDPRYGTIADSPSDVTVLVNAAPANVDYVYGLLGAIVLTNKPVHGDTVLVDYKYLKNPPTQLQRLNSWEFYLNQAGNKGFSGYPNHVYRQRSYLLNPGDPRLVKSPVSPEKISYKYKGYELAYSARLNDPTSLLLNSPTNKLLYTVYNELLNEQIIRWDPVTLPNAGTDPWIYNGDGTSSLVINPPSLELQDTSKLYGSDPGPPFYSHAINLTFPSDISTAFRFYSLIDNNTVPEQDFYGVGFGVNLGSKSSLLGILKSDAVNLSTAIALANALKAAYVNHINYVGVHQPIDSVNVVTIVDAYDLPSLFVLTEQLIPLYLNHITVGPNNVHKNQDFVNTFAYGGSVTTLGIAIGYLNDLRVAFNGHLVQSNVHYSNDNLNSVDRLKAVGILTNRGFIEDQNSWELFAYDWTIETTYRLYVDSSGTATVYLSGDISPRASVALSDLPDASSLDLRFDPVYQVYFGSFADFGSNISYWRFIRVDVNPINDFKLLQNKSVNYPINTVPELDPSFPWINVGQGTELIYALNSLQVDSLSSIRDPDAIASGIISGEYRGYLRVEPSLTDRNIITCEFSASSPMFSHGIDNRSLGLHLGDGTFATQLCFIQANPTPANVKGSIFEPSISISTGDDAVFAIDDSQLIVVTAPSNIITAAGIVSLINSAVGFAFASIYTDPYTAAITVQFTTQSIGAESLIRVVSGQIFDKLGIVTGVFVYGNDSKPESKFGYSGIDLPNLDNPDWVQNGNQTSYMRERTLIIEDTSALDYRSYSQTNNYVTDSVFFPSDNWKTDFRVKVRSYVAGGVITGAVSLSFAGMLFNVDEGPLGKTLELHFSINPTGDPVIGVYSYNSGTNDLDYVTSYPFPWNDQEFHAVSLYTDKIANSISIFADGLFIGTFGYTSLNDGVYGPSLTFGSGSNTVNNGDPSSSLSVTEWTSVCATHDSTVNNINLANQRYVALYRGGDITKLSSYYISQIDWKTNHTYRIIRDPVSGVTVFIDGSEVPNISASYDVLTLPLSSVDFLAGVVPSGKFIAWGSFNSKEIIRSLWVNDFSYSIGRLDNNNNLVPPHQVLNQANVVASPDHLFTKQNHQHYGTRVYSGGTPPDEFMSDSTVAATTILGTGTPPFAKSQDLTTQGGLDTSATPVDLLSNLNILSSGDSLANFINDTVNVPSGTSLITYTTALSNLVNDATSLRTKYLSHILKTVVGLNNFHANPDTFNNVVTAPVAGNLASCLSCVANLISEYNDHRVQAAVHYNDDTLHISNALIPTNLGSCISSLNDLAIVYNDHLNSRVPHLAPGFAFSSLSFSIASLNLLRDVLIDHMSNDGIISHNTTGNDPDTANATLLSLVPYAFDLPSAFTLAISIKAYFNSHLINAGVGFPHTNLDPVNTIVSLDPIDEASLLTITTEAYTNYNQHRVNGGGVFHNLADIINIFTIFSSTEYLVRFITDFIGLLNQHVLDPSVHIVLNPENQTLFSIPFNISGPNTVVDQTQYIDLLVQLSGRLKSHLLNTNSHLTSDYVNFDLLDAIPDPIDFTTSMAYIIGLLGFLADHNNPAILNETQAHQTVDSANIYTISSNYDPLPPLIINSNDLATQFVNHSIFKPSHLKIDDSYVAAVATGLSTTIDLLNTLKADFNAHRTKPGVHVRNDTVNIVVAPDATDLDSAITLYNAVLAAFNSHRILAGVHSNSAIITLTQPSGTLYDGIKFWTINSGTPDITSSFSDDETLYLGSIQNQKVYRLSYQGSHLPNLLSITGSVSEPFPTLPGSSLLVDLDYGQQLNVLFQVGDTTAAAAVARINGTVGIPLNFASVGSSNQVILTNPNTTSSKYLAVSGSSSSILGLDTGIPVPWALTSDNSGAVSVAVIPGSPDYLRYGTSGLGTRTAYVAGTALTDGSSVGFSISFRIRINSWSFLPNGETGIYVGCSSNSGPGFTLGIGFIEMATKKTVILKDMNSGTVVGVRVFDWGDGSFHTYTLTKDNISDSIELTII